MEFHGRTDQAHDAGLHGGVRKGGVREGGVREGGVDRFGEPLEAIDGGDQQI